jgi:hypothetical protein
MFSLLVRGNGLVFHAQEVYVRHDLAGEEIRREMERMR